MPDNFCPIFKKMMTIPNTSAGHTFELYPSGVASESFEDEIILINLPRGNYYSLRHSAFALWQELLAGASKQQMADFLVQTFGIATDIATTDVESFTQQLLDEGLVAVREVSELVYEPSADTRGAEYTKPQLETYTDMQDLLMLDPIHDVDSEQGWPIKK